MSPLRFLHQNIQGLNPSKFEFFAKSLREPVAPKFILISETWWPRNDEWEHDPHTVFTSLRTPRRQYGHQNGGLAVLAMPNQKHAFTLLSRSPYHIYFKYETIKLLYLYIPATMSDAKFQEEIQPSLLSCLTDKPDILVGDLNICFNRENNTSGSCPQSRKRLVSEFATNCGLEWIRADNNSAAHKDLNATWDHAFARNDLALRWTYHPTKVASDHGVIDAHVTGYAERVQREAMPPETTRFNIRRLSKERYKTRYVKYFQDNYGGSESLIGEINKFRQAIQGNEFELDGIQEVIDMYDLVITERVWDTAENTIGNYTVNEARLQPDRILEEIDAVKTNVEAQILFKRAQRGAQVPLEPSEPGRNVLDEATQLYQDIWSREQRHTEELPILRFDDPLPFTREVVKKKIQKYPASKAPGFDSIHVALLKHLVDTDFLDDLFGLFALCYQTGITPKTWNEGLTCLLAKDKNSPVVTKTRPISLTRMFRRLFENICHDLWVPEGWAKMHRAQSGCRRGFSTFTQCTINDYLSRHPLIRGDPKRVYTILLDISKAFDSVRHKDVLRKLKERGCPERELSLIYHLFVKDTKTRLIINGIQSGEIELTNGIFQGSVLSPFLFMIWIDDLCEELNGDVVTFDRALFFVDDIALKCVTVHEAIRQLAICENWAIRHGILFNAIKSVVIRPPDDFSEPDLFIHGDRIPVERMANYLGVPSTNAGTQYTELVKRNFKKAIDILRFLEARGRSWPEWAKLQIYKSFVDSQFNYMGPGLDAWIKTQHDPTITLTGLTYDDDGPETREFTIQEASELLLKRALRWIFNRYTDYCNDTLRHMTLLLSPTQKWDLLRTQFYHFQENLHDDNPILEIRDLHRQNFPVFWGAQNYLSRVFERPPIYPAFLQAAQAAQDNGTPIPSIRKFLRLSHIADQRLQAPSTNTLRYVLPVARKGTISKIDKSLSIRDANIRNNVISWRINRFMANHYCPTCNQYFKRSCPTSCGLLHGFQGITEYIWNRYEAEKLILRDEDQDLFRQTHRVNINAAQNYTIIDSLINNGEWNLLEAITKHLAEKIDGERVRRLHVLLRRR